MKSVPRKLAEGFDSRSGHTDDLKNGSFGLSAVAILSGPGPPRFLLGPLFGPPVFFLIYRSRLFS